MNGAESLVRTLVAGGATTCFSNPGTSEMHFVAALDRVEGMECVLCLFEGVATGAADGWARMTGRPGLTLLHLGPGLANGLANLHNAKKAHTPIVNVVGEHTTQHLAYEAPLTSDTEGVARPMSHWVRTGSDSTTIAADGAAALAAARTGAGQIATLILPADTAWGPGGPVVQTIEPAPPAKVDDTVIRAAADACRRGRETVLFLGSHAVRDKSLVIAAAIAEKTGCRIMGRTALPRIERGVGRVPLPRLPYAVDDGLEALRDVNELVLVGAPDPVSFFNYPGKPSRLMPPGSGVMTLAAPEDDMHGTLLALAELVGADPARVQRVQTKALPLPQDAPLTVERAMTAVAALLPEAAIIVDESITAGRWTGPLTAHAAPHDWLQITGGSIGIGPPLALGAAVAAKDRKVVNLQADGSAMYTLQALWSQARAKANVLTIIWSNRSYEILRAELMNVGANPGRKAIDMLSLDSPAIDWVKLSEGMGVPAIAVSDVRTFIEALRTGLAENGPFLIEAFV